METVIDGTSTNYRKCKRCGQILPITDFRANSSCRGGYEPTCKHCKNVVRTKARRASTMDIYLADISDEVIFSEMRRRGFSGELHKTETVTI